jgi:hypothetical protein
MNMQSGEDNSLLDSIVSFCRSHNMAESTFGRRAVNDGKFVSRLRDGARITPETWERVARFISKKGGEVPEMPDPKTLHLMALHAETRRDGPHVGAAAGEDSSRKDFRFFDNRQKYLLFVNTCSEKEIIARRFGMELSNLHPQPPAVRVFDGGIGDGSVLTSVMREMHRRFPSMPFYISGKEISLEDIRLTLTRMADRLYEHPATVLALTNMYYSEAPWLLPNRTEAARSLVWKEVALTGQTAHEFDEQLRNLNGFLTENWQARHSPRTGNPVYDRPVALVIYREDCRFLLHDVVPVQGAVKADFDLVMASQPYRLRAPAEFKAQKVLAPLVRSLRKGGRLLGIHSYGRDPGMEIIKSVWPEEDPFTSNRHDIMRAVKAALARDRRHYNFNAYADSRAIFRYQMHTLPSEIDSSIGTSTLFAAWNAAIYVAQIEDQRLEPELMGTQYFTATREVLQKHGGLWFYDESFVVSRKRD